jgi:FixJ family two-component response regulator
MTRRSARRRGAYLLLNKPVDDQALLDAINWVMEKARTYPLAHDERS